MSKNTIDEKSVPTHQNFRLDVSKRFRSTPEFRKTKPKHTDKATANAPVTVVGVIPIFLALSIAVDAWSLIVFFGAAGLGLAAGVAAGATVGGVYVSAFVCPPILN